MFFVLVIEVTAYFAIAKVLLIVEKLLGGISTVCILFREEVTDDFATPNHSTLCLVVCQVFFLKIY